MFIRAIAALWLIAVSSPALALEPDAVFASFAAKLRQAGMTASYGQAEVVGNDGVIFSQVSLSRASPGAQPDAPPESAQTGLESLELQIASIEFAGLAMHGTDGMSASRLSVGPVTAQSTDGQGRPVQTRMESAKITNFYLPQSGSGEPAVARQAPTLGEYGAASITIAGIKVLTMDGANYSAGYDASGKIVEYSGSAPQILVDYAAAPPKLKAQMAALGLEKMQLSLSYQGLWNLDSGRIDLKQFKLEAKDAGAISLSAAVLVRTVRK